MYQLVFDGGVPVHHRTTGQNHSAETVWPYFDGAVDADRIAHESNGNFRWYWTRSPFVSSASYVRCVSSDGYLYYYLYLASHADGGVRPALTLKSEIPVTGIPNADGVYEIEGGVEPPEEDAVNSLFDDDDILLVDVTQKDIDNAMALVLNLEDGEAKNVLLHKLEEAQDQLNAKKESLKYGDVTGDGNIAVADAILVLRHIVGLITLEEDQISRAKVSDGGGELAVGDAILILRYIVGLIKEFPAQK